MAHMAIIEMMDPGSVASDRSLRGVQRERIAAAGSPYRPASRQATHRGTLRNQSRLRSLDEKLP